MLKILIWNGKLEVASKSSVVMELHHWLLLRSQFWLKVWLRPLVLKFWLRPQFQLEITMWNWFWSRSASFNPAETTSCWIPWITFVFGNVSRCNGCKGKIKSLVDNKPLPPSEDLVLGHKEFVIFFSNPKTGHYEQSWGKEMSSIMHRGLALSLTFKTSTQDSMLTLALKLKVDFNWNTSSSYRMTFSDSLHVRFLLHLGNPPTIVSVWFAIS